MEIEEPITVKSPRGRAGRQEQRHHQQADQAGHLRHDQPGPRPRHRRDAGAGVRASSCRSGPGDAGGSAWKPSSRQRARRRRTWSPGRRWSPSSATSTTARPACWTRSATPTWPPARPAASRSTPPPGWSTAGRGRDGQARHVHRHARPPGVHEHACPRGEHDRRGRAGGQSPPRACSRRRSSRSTTPGPPSVPIVVAMNKIDRADANPDMVLGQLAAQGLNPVEWGGDVEVDPHQRHHRPGHPRTDRNPRLQSQLMELKADPTAPARGTVIESLDRSRASAPSPPSSCRTAR